MFNKRKGNRPGAEVNSGSMADIAFLLLIFFLVTTTIASDKGIPVILPPKKETQDDIKIKEKNIFNVLINSSDQLLVEEQPMDIKDLKDAAKKFLTNNGRDPESSDSPQKAVISLKADRGTGYGIYIRVRDVLQLAYNELRAETLGITVPEFLELVAEKDKPENKEKYDKAKEAYPVRISDAEPTAIGE